jgi:hypothetical protein
MMQTVFAGVVATIAIATFIGQLRVFRGSLRDPDWPLIDAKTPEGRVAALCLHGGFMLFVVGLFIAQVVA